MRLKRNIVTSIFAGVFILIAVMGLMHMAAIAYERFERDGMNLIFLVLIVVAVLLFFIGCFLLHEKAGLRHLQDEKAGLIIVEGLICVALIGVGFYMWSSTSTDCAVWTAGCLALVYAICRIMGNRLCGLLGLIFSFSTFFFIYDSGWYVFSSDDMIKVFTFLVPFLVFLIMTKYVIPQFANNSAVVVLALVVLAAVFGTAVVLNPISISLVIGCVIALLFSNIRTVDTTMTKGPVMAVILLFLSAGGVIGMSFLLEKDFMTLFSFDLDPLFTDAMNNGTLLDYCIDKLGDLLAVMQYSFDYAIYPIVLMILTIVAGVAAIRRKLSSIGPLLLSFIAVTVAYVVGGEPGSVSLFFNVSLGIFAAYGLFYLLLPEFLSRFEEDDDVKDMFETDSAPATPPTEPVLFQDSVAVENKNASASNSDSVSEAAENAPSEAAPEGPEVPSVGVDMRFSKKQTTEPAPTPTPAPAPVPTPAPTPTPAADPDLVSNFQEWHVSEEFVREDKVKKEKQLARERSYQMAKERQEAEAKGEPIPEAAQEPIPTFVEPEVEEKPGRVVYVEQEVGNYHAPIAPTIPPANQEEPQYNVLGFKQDDPEQSLKSSFKPDSDTIIMSGYQNSAPAVSAEILMAQTTESFGADLDPQSLPAADLLTAINGAEVPTVEIPDVPPVGVSTPQEQAATVAPDMASGAMADGESELAAVARDFVQEGVDGGSIRPGEDEQLDNLLERLDMSDSIKRMSASAKEDMADVIEHPTDPTEAEVVLDSRDYNFGGEEGEYGEVPTVSDLEDKWRAEEQMRAPSTEPVPDVVSAEDVAGEQSLSIDPMMGMYGTDPSMSMLSTDAEIYASNETEEESNEAIATASASSESSDSSDSTGSDGMMGFDFTGFDKYEEPSDGFEDMIPDESASQLGAGVGTKEEPAGILGEGTGLPAYPEGLLNSDIISNNVQEDTYDTDDFQADFEALNPIAPPPAEQPAAAPEEPAAQAPVNMPFIELEPATELSFGSTEEQTLTLEPEVTPAAAAEPAAPIEPTPAPVPEPVAPAAVPPTPAPAPAPSTIAILPDDIEDYSIPTFETPPLETYVSFEPIVPPSMVTEAKPKAEPEVAAPIDDYSFEQQFEAAVFSNPVAEPEPVVAPEPVAPVAEPEPIAASIPEPEPIAASIPEPEPLVAPEPIAPTIEPMATMAEPEPVVAVEEPVIEPVVEPVTPAVDDFAFDSQPQEMSFVEPEITPVAEPEITPAVEESVYVEPEITPIAEPEPVISHVAPEPITPITAPEPVAPAADESVYFEPEITPTAEPEPVISHVAPEPITPITAPEPVSPAADESVYYEPEVASAAEPEPIVSSVKPEPVAPAPEESFESLSFKDLASQQQSIRKFEPEHIERPAPEPVANYTQESPVYSFTSRDVNIDVTDEERGLGIPKPGQHSYRRPSAVPPEAAERPSAAALDRYERDVRSKPIHTEEVVARNGGGSRSYHKIVIK